VIAFQVIGSLVVILGGLVLVLQLLKKYVPSMAVARDLAIVEQLHLGDRCRVMVVKIRGEELLIGVTRESISILDKLPKVVGGPAQSAFKIPESGWAGGSDV
jgi:flagellar biogenesis protein FliO